MRCRIAAPLRALVVFADATLHRSRNSHKM
jgi:hypothetical protein